MNLHPTIDWYADDIVEAFKKFKQKTQLAFKSFLKGTTADEKVSYILLWTGEKGLDLFNSWDMSESDYNNPDTLLEKFERYLEPRSNHRIHRYEFQGLKQDPQETIDNFLSRLKNVAEKCKFKDKDERIVDQLIWGCAHKEVQKSLIAELNTANYLSVSVDLKPDHTRVHQLTVIVHYAVSGKLILNSKNRDFPRVEVDLRKVVDLTNSSENFLKSHWDKYENLEVNSGLSM
ncbi:Hypothetical predicted protein [Octopus vulgaris]|uniref:Retrotransposon gag domain-containing protein n=1 Tax=Octopus vulgaris TaxID=6645 RepID=A0AA36AJQ5_OCTVU|nr:Hypothetical predicted protein [Octopus vulgaris]